MNTRTRVLFIVGMFVAAAAFTASVTAYGYSYTGYRVNSPTMYAGQYTSFGYGNIGAYDNQYDGYRITSPYNQYPVRNVYVYENPQFRGHQSNWYYSGYRNGYTGQLRMQTPTFQTSIPLASRSMHYY